MYLIDLPALLIGAMFFNGFWAVAFSVIFIFVLILSSSAEVFGLSYFAVLVYFVAMAVFTSSNPFIWIWHHPAEVAGLFVGYFFIGALYSSLKYSITLRNVLKEVREVKISFIEQESLGIDPTSAIPDWASAAWSLYKRQNLRSSTYYKVNNGLRPSDQKALILNWIAFWPFSAIGLFVADPLQYVVTSVYRFMVSTYARMYERLVAKHINLSDIE